MYLTDDNGRPYVEPIGSHPAVRVRLGRRCLRTAVSPRNAAAGAAGTSKDPRPGRLPAAPEGPDRGVLGRLDGAHLRHAGGALGAAPGGVCRQPPTRLTWEFDFGQLLAQPLLMRDHLEPYREPLERYARDPPDIIDQAGLLWKLIYGSVGDGCMADRAARGRRAPARGGAAPALYARLGLTWSDEVADRVRQPPGRAIPPKPRAAAPTPRRATAVRARVAAWRQRLDAEQVARVYELTVPVASRYYSDSDW